MDPTRPPVVVLAAHGSRADEANESHRRLARSVAGALELTVLPGFLELTEPTIAGAIDDAVATGADTVLVLPYFLHPGRHLTADVPAIVDEARTRHPGVDVRLLASFGDDPALVELLARQVRSQLGPA